MIVMPDEFQEDSLQVGFAEWNHEIEALPSNGTDQSLTERVCLGRPDRCLQGAHPEAFSIQHPDKVKRAGHGHEARTGRGDRRRGLPELMEGPFSSWMRGGIDVKREPISIATKTYSIRNVAVTEMKKSQATIAWAWLCTNVLQR
jgi:hypothetical protein